VIFYLGKGILRIICQVCSSFFVYLPFRDKSFDVTVSYSSIEHAKSNYLEWIKEMIRVTKIGGYITITTSNKLNLLLVLLLV